MSAESESADVFDFVDAYLRDLERGEDRPLAYWLARFPRSQDAIAKEWLALRHPQGEAGQEHKRARAAADAADPDERVGPYRILRELGRGGQGTVFLAEDTRIARRVALKVLASRFDSISDEKRQRFRREAEVIARLEHPGLCTIHDAELEGDAPWIAMRYVEGRTLAECLSDAKRAGGAEVFGLRFPPRSTLEIHAVLLLVERAARALHAAHEAGVVHRDVKPGNVIVALDGRPVLLDFGLARDESSETGTLTQSGDVFGTPAYMSPEQLTQRSAELDRRTDVYSLGVALYEALTLERPFDQAVKCALYRAIQSDPPPDPRKKNKHLSEDVKVVLETALEKERERRYATALDLAEDLRRIREYEPIHARPASVSLKFRRWTRRHPALAAATIGTILSLSIGLGVTLELLADERRANSFALGKHLAQRAVALSVEDPPTALVLGIKGVELAPNELTRASLFTALDACWLARAIEVGNESDANRIVDIAANPVRDWAAIAFDDGSVHLVDLLSGERQARIEAHACPVIEMEFDARGERLLTAFADGVVESFEAGTGARLCALDAGSPLASVRFRPDGRAFLVVSRDKVEVRDAGSFAATATLACDPGEFTSARFAPDGPLILALTPGRSPAVFDEHSGQRLRELGSGGGTNCAEFSAGAAGSRLVLGCIDGAVHVVDARTGLELGPTMRFDGPPTSVVPSPDGMHVAVIVNHGEEGSVYSCDLATGRAQRLASHRGRRVTQAAFSPDGKRLATTSFDTSVRIWDVGTGLQLRAFTVPLRQHDVAWSASGERLITRPNSWAAQVWYACARPDVFDLEGHTGAVRSVAISPDGRVALTASEDGSARLWNVAPDSGSRIGTQIAVMRESGPLLRAASSADGATVLTVGAQGTARTWDGRTGAALRPVAQHHNALIGAALDPTGARFVTLCADGRVRLWNSRLDAPPIELEAEPLASSVACFSTDGGVVAVGGAEDSVRLFDANDGHLLRRLEFTHKEPQQGGVVALAFRPRADELAVACGDIRSRFFSPVNGQGTRPDIVAFVCQELLFSRDGAQVLLVGRFGGGAVRSIALGSEVKAFPRSSHTDDLTSASYSNDGRLVLTTSRDGTARVWTAHDGAPIARREDFGSEVLCGALSDAGGEQRAITGCANGRVCVWPIDPLPAARARRPRGLTIDQVKRERELALPLDFQ